MLQNYWQVLLPEISLLGSACVVLFLGMGGNSGYRRSIAAPLSLIVLIVIAFITVVRSGQYSQWSDPVQLEGIYVTPLTLYVRLMALLVGVVLVLVNWHQPEASEQGEYFAMVLFSLAGVMLLSLSNDLLMFFFSLELVSVPTYVLVALSRKDVRAQEASSKYFFLGALAAALTAYGLSFLYGATGQTRLVGGADSIAAKLLGDPLQSPYIILAFLLIVGGLSFKIAAVPFHGYVADVYQGAASPLAGLLAFVPKFAGFVAMIQLFNLVEWNLSLPLQWAIWALATATMTVGNVLALLQQNVKRMLAYSSVAHSGYMLVGLLVGPLAGEGPLHDGLSALLFYIAVYGLMNLGVFAILASLSTETTEVEDLDQLAGLAQRQPLTALGLAICLFSLMGFPPTAGFLGKLYIFSSVFSGYENSPLGTALIWLAVIGVLNSAVGAAYYLRVVMYCYIKPPTVGDGILPPSPAFLSIQIGAATCSLMMIMWFIWPQSLLVQSATATGSWSVQSVQVSESHLSTPNHLKSDQSD